MSTARPQLEALIADPDRSTVDLIRSLLITSRRIHAVGAYDRDGAWQMLGGPAPLLLFITHVPPRLNAPELTRELRRSDLGTRKIPVVMLATDPTPSQVSAARDAGVHEVLRKPFTMADLLLRVDNVLTKPRNWVEGIGYVGPDRRRFNSALLASQSRRRVDKESQSPEKARIGQALKIMKAAIDAIDRDPKQALRALDAQADELEQAAVAMADYALAGAARTLRSCLAASVVRGRFSSQQMAADLGQLFPQAVRSPVAQAAPQRARVPGRPIWWVN